MGDSWTVPRERARPSGNDDGGSTSNELAGKGDSENKVSDGDSGGGSTSAAVEQAEDVADDSGGGSTSDKVAGKGDSENKVSDGNSGGGSTSTAVEQAEDVADESTSGSPSGGGDSPISTDTGDSGSKDSAATPSEEKAGIGVTVSDTGGDISNAITPGQLSQIDEQTPGSVEADDLRLVNGDLQFSRQFKSDLEDQQRQEATEKLEQSLEQQIMENRVERYQNRGYEGSQPTAPDLEAGEDFEVVRTDEGYRATDVSTGIEQNKTVAASQLEAQLEEQLGRDVERGEDYTVQETEEGGFEATTTDSLNQEMASDQQPGRRDTDIFSGVVSGTEDALSEVAQFASGRESTRVEFQGEGSVVNVAAQEDTDLTADLGPVSDAGDKLTEIGATIDKKVVKPTAQVGGDIGDVIQTGAGATLGSPASSPQRVEQAKEQQADKTLEDRTAEFKDVTRGEQQDVTPETKTERFTEGAVGGGLAILNFPAIGGTVVDAGEFAVEGTSRSVEGEGGEFAKTAGGQAAAKGAQAAEFASSNPTKFTGQVAGGLATSAGLIGGARKLGGARAGRAASFGIQPGEELAITAARRGVPGTRRLANAVGDVDVRKQARQLAGEERGTGQFKFESRSETEPEITAEDLDVKTQPTRPPETRTDVTGYERRRKQRSRTEEGGMTDAERIELERQVKQRRREKAEEPQVTKSESPVGVESDLTPIIRPEIATGLQEQAVAQDLSVGAIATEPIGATRAGLDVTPRAETGLEVGLESGQETRTETRQEVSQELRTELDTRAETRTETRTESKLEPKAETRSEQRVETRAETRAETDVDLLEDDDEELAGVGDDGEKAFKKFEYGVASPGDVLSGDAL